MRPGRAGLIAILALGPIFGLETTAAEAPPPSADLATPLDHAAFVDQTARSGVRFHHRHFGTGEKYMPENMGPGVAIVDVDGDGDLDLVFPQGAPIAAQARAQVGKEEASNRLFRNHGDGTFEDATAGSGLEIPGVSMGLAFGDIDADGDPDLYLSQFGPDLLLRNRGDGTFEDATTSAGIEDDLWSASAGFFDADGDGDLDLYVTRYVDFSLANHKWCGNAQKKLRAYCHPDVYQAAPDTLYLGDGKGRFQKAAESAGIVPTPEGKGLGLALGDFDGDGRQDIYVANDSTMNLLYLARGGGRFEESALLAGVGFDASGKAEAGMGVAAGDLDGDGLIDLFVTHLDQETNTLYRNQGGGLFEEMTRRSGLAAPSLPWVGFGTVLLDHDQDGDLDILVTNGHIIDNIARFDSSRSHEQPSQLFDNLGRGHFQELPGALGLGGPLVGRGAAAGDLDRDGDLDLVLTQNGGEARVLENQAGHSDRALAVRLKGPPGNPRAIGARLQLTLSKRKQQKEVQDLEGQDKWRQVRAMLGASGYLSQGPPEVYFAVPEGAKATLQVDWPSGKVSRFEELAPGHLYVLGNTAEGSPSILEEYPFPQHRASQGSGREKAENPLESQVFLDTLSQRPTIAPKNI